MKPHLARLAAGIGGLALLMSVSTSAMAKPVSTSNWHDGVYNASGRALSNAQAASTPDGLAKITFTHTPDTALLTTSQGNQRGALLGDLTGKTVTATYTITGSGPFTYYGQPGPCATPASARLFFETSNASGFDETHYWWSNPESAVLDATGSTVTLTASISGSQWSDFNGHFGTDNYAAGFASAAANVTDIGLSFGGGCGFENGVGAPDATLTLDSFTVS